MSRFEPDDEVLPTGPGLPRWLPWLAAAVLVAVALVAILSRLPSGTTSAAPTPTLGRSSDVAPSSAPAPAPVATGEPLELPRGAEPVDIAVVGDEAWLLQGNLLSTFTTDADYRIRRLEPLPASGEALPRVYVDTTAHRVWVVASSDHEATAWAYDSETLAPVATLRRRQPVESAAALAGALYFSDRSGVYRFAPGTALQTVADGPDGELVADPIRSRVLLVRPGVPARLIVIPTRGRLQQLTLPTSLATGTLAVTGTGDIWIGGYAEDGAVLERLDPRTFQALTRSPIAFEAGSGVQIIASGTDDLLIETGEVPLELACMDGSDGRAVQRWPLLTQDAALTRHAGYALVDAEVVPLELHGACTG